MRLTLRPYQREAVKWMLAMPQSGLFADPGMGKTAVSLAVLTVLKNKQKLKKALIIAPLRVAISTWPDELESWDQFSELSYHVLHGKKKNIHDKSDIHLINPEGLDWFWKQKLNNWQYDTLIVDESTKFKNFNKRTKQLLARTKKFERRHILTGTPAPRSLLNLFTQIKILDDGKTLGSKIGEYKRRYFVPCGYMNYNWKIKNGAQEEIEKKIAPIVSRLDAKDYLDVPDILEHKIIVKLDKKEEKIYRTMEKELFADLEDDSTILASSKAGSYQKCRQIANGFVYDIIDDNRIPHIIHRKKIEAIVDFVEEMNGKPVFIAYWYKYDLEMLREVFPGAPVINGKTSAKTSDRYIVQWNKDEIPILLAQPISCSHGLNMQKGSASDIVWYSIPDDLEIYTQFNDRIHRSGVKSRVRVHHVIAHRTIDEAIMVSLKLKGSRQERLLEALKRYRG